MRSVPDEHTVGECRAWYTRGRGEVVAMTEQAGSTSAAGEVAALQAEVERLRAQNAELSAGGRTPRRWNGRAVSSVALMVVASLLLPVAVVSFWAQRTLLDTEQYVSTVAPLSQDPTIRVAVGEVISTQLHERVDLQQRVYDLLPDQAKPLAGPIAGGVQSFVDQQIQNFLASDAFSDLWVAINTRTQQSLVSALQGNPTGAITIEGSQVVLDTGVIAEQVKQRLVDRGLTVLQNVPLPPQADRQIVLLDSPQLAELRAAYTVAQPVAHWLIYVVLAMFVGAVLLARRRARAVLVVGAVCTVVAVLLRLGMLVGEGVFTSQLAGTPFELSAAVFYSTLLTYLQITIRAMFVLGLILCFAGWFAGAAPSAVRSREWLSGTLSGAGSRTLGGRLGPVGEWVHRQRVLLRVAVLLVAAVVLLTQDRLTGAVLIWTLVLTLLALAVIEFVGGGREVRQDAAVPTGTGPDG